MKGYKGFEEGLICKGKQYEENTVFEEENAEICKSGMHFCEYPFDVFRYYHPCDNGKFQEFAEVEALNKPITDDNHKFCTTKLKIGTKLKFSDFIKLGIEFNLKKANKETANSNGDCSGANSNGYCSGANSNGDCSGANSNGYYSGANSNGDCSGANSNGDCSGANSNGYYSGANSNGDCSGANSNGYCSGANSNGNYSGANSNGYCSGANSNGYYSGANSNGDCSGANSNGNYSGANSNGNYSGANSNGNYSGAMAIGDKSSASCGYKSIAVANGRYCKCKGKNGSVLLLVFLDDERNIKHYKAIKIGHKYKEDVWYSLNESGKVVEVK